MSSHTEVSAGVLIIFLNKFFVNVTLKISQQIEDKKGKCCSIFIMSAESSINIHYMPQSLQDCLFQMKKKGVDQDNIL